MSNPRFIGIDLAWQSDKNHTGIVVLEGSPAGAVMMGQSEAVLSTSDVEAYISKFAVENTVIAIDAPLIIENVEGQRPCETEVSRQFGSFHAGAHTSNLKRYPDPKSVKLAQWLLELGFNHVTDQPGFARQSGQWMFEVYPHPATIVLFNLKQIIKYKKGKVTEKRAGLKRLQRYIRTFMVEGRAPRIVSNGILEALLNVNVALLKGQQLKRLEDTLDALICAYLALYYWWWGADKNEIIGDLESGYIIVPKKTT